MKVTVSWLWALAALCAALPAHAIDRHQVWHQGRQIDVVDRGGWAIYDGDMIIGRTAEVLERSARTGPDGRHLDAVAKSNTLGNACCRWPRGTSGLFEVPYVVESDPDGNIPAAITLFNQQLAGFMRAVPRTIETDYVAFTLSATDNGGSCASNIGRVGGRQTIIGSRVCGTGVLVHELGHAIGLFHEQVHVDRASFVVVNEANVDPARVHNYQPSTNRRGASPYDFGSLMHYGPSSFSRDGRLVSETIPAGIPIGQRAGFSAADIEGIRRLYSDPAEQVTVTTNPTGLTVIVDGATVVTPATFNWSIGSTHLLDVPANPQVASGAAHVFGRWNVDVAGDLAARRTITVAAGDGSLTAPSSRPAVSTYTANFVRYKEVRITTGGTPGGSVVASPAPTSLPGVTGTYYRDRQAFALEPFAAGTARLGQWSGSYFFNAAYTTSYSSPFRGPLAISDTSTTAYEYRASFVNYPFVTLRGRAQDGEVYGVTAAVTRASATSPTSIRLPYNTVSWTDGESVSIAIDTVQTPYPDTMRYVFQDWDGAALPTTVVVMPTALQSSRTVTANFSKEYQAYRQVIPGCGGSISMPGEASAWYAHGSNVSVSLTPNAGWVMAGWEGSLSGTATLGAFQVTTHPNVVARLNTIAAPLAVTSVSPSTIAAGQSSDITINGSGFTEASEVYVSGVRQPSQYGGSNRLTANVAATALASGGLAIVNVINRVGTCSVNATGGIDVLGTVTASFEPQTGWWWNAGEAGRGFFFEKRGGNLFMAGYYYEGDGRATWFSAAGPMAGNTFAGGMSAYRSGQTLTGTYRSPSASPSPGIVNLVFTSGNTATLTWPGGVTALTRFTFGSGGAGLPENGWWWSSAESGRGYSIEIQGNAIFMAGFMYDEAGNPVWYYAQGTVNAGNVFSSTWVQNANGQTLTGAYRAPIVLNSNVGSLTLAFTGTRAATLTLPNGRAVALTRFDF